MLDVCGVSYMTQHGTKKIWHIWSVLHRGMLKLQECLKISHCLKSPELVLSGHAALA